MPSYPAETLRRALREAGIEYGDQDRLSLRGLLEERIGEAPPERCTADELAQMVLTLMEHLDEEPTRAARRPPPA